MKHASRRRILGLAVFISALLILLLPRSQPAGFASLVAMSGDLASFLNALPLPGSNTEAFIIPSDADITTWRQAVRALFTEDYHLAATLSDPLGYDVIQYTDIQRSKTYYVLRERNNARGLGTYVYNPTACRTLSVHAPHAGGDLNTRPQSIAMFLELNAVTLLIAGTHRCSNSQASPCDGTTSVCRGTEAPYPISDVSHYTQNFFQPAHEEIVTKIPDITTVSVHGFAWRAGDPDVITSNGTSADLSQSLTIRLADQYNQKFNQLGIPLRAGSCNQTGGPTRLCATTNVQGRFVNGSADVCRQGVSTISGPERFIHIEQSCAMRQISNCTRPASVPYQVTIEVFAAVFPCSPRAKAGRNVGATRVE